MSVRTMKRGGRIAWAMSAAVLSLALHGVLLDHLPPLPLGRITDTQRWVDYPSIALRDVQPLPPEPERPPARFRPEDPGEVLDQLAAAGGPVGGFSLPVPAAPEISAGPVQGADEALLEPPPPEPRPLWDPREEILQIDRAIIDDQISALPRRYTEAIERTVRVPDVTLPVEKPVDFAAALGGAGEVGIESVSRPVEWPEGWGASLLGALEPGSDLLPEAVSGAARRDPTMVVLPAIEEYLAIDVQKFQPPDDPKAVYFRIEIQRFGEERLPELPKDVLLLQDSSESMTPAKLAECKRGLRRWLDWIGPDDRFQIIGFSDKFNRCFAEPWQTMNPRNRQQAMDFIDTLRATGNTDVYGSLAAAASLPRDPNRPYLVVLITDGRPTTGVTLSSDIIERFSAENNGRLSMFSVGSGRRVNRFLLDLLSYRNRGDSLVVPDDTLLASAMERWARETRRPVLADLRYRFTGIAQDDVYPRALTPLFLDRPLLLYGRTETPAAGAAFQIVGRSGVEERDLVFPLDLSAARSADQDLRQRWAWHRVYHLIGEHTRTGDESLVQTIRATAARYGLVVPYGYGDAVPRW